MCIRIWDNIFAFGTIFMFKFALAVLKFVQYDLIRLDLQGVNDFFRLFKEDEDNGLTKAKVLPETEVLITESLKIKLSEDRLEDLKYRYKE